LGRYILSINAERSECNKPDKGNKPLHLIITLSLFSAFSFSPFFFEEFCSGSPFFPAPLYLGANAIRLIL